MAQKGQTYLDTMKVSKAVRSTNSDDAGAEIIQDTMVNFKKRLEANFSQIMRDKMARLKKSYDKLIESKDKERDLLVAKDQAELRVAKADLEFITDALKGCQDALEIVRVDKFEMQRQLALEQRENYELQRAFRDERRAAKMRGTTSDPEFTRMMKENQRKDKIIARMTNFLKQGNARGALDVVTEPSFTNLEEVDAIVL